MRLSIGGYTVGRDRDCRAPHTRACGRSWSISIRIGLSRGSASAHGAAAG